jgi:hypothetical protein
MTARKDYYSILMVHPKAETFLIEAAYRRLAREYHPDVSKASNAHEKMTDINEAYEVLSDPVRRKAYDQEDVNTAVPKHTSTANPANATAESAEGQAPPIPPDPALYGISPGYLERAIEGARLWRNRERRIPKWLKWAIPIACISVGVALPLALAMPHSEFHTIAAFAWCAFLLSQIPIVVIEKMHDSHLKRAIFNPQYNPNPEGYNTYAIEYAKYETAIATVYVSRNWKYHLNISCCGMNTYYSIPKWLAVARGSSACSHCGYRAMPIRRLPPPFGNGFLPQVAS